MTEPRFEVTNDNYGEIRTDEPADARVRSPRLKIDTSRVMNLKFVGEKEPTIRGILAHRVARRLGKVVRWLETR